MRFSAVSAGRTPKSYLRVLKPAIERLPRIYEPRPATPELTQAGKGHAMLEDSACAIKHRGA
jgi:hypothetical protein